jgi:hypothetical protein
MINMILGLNQIFSFMKNVVENKICYHFQINATPYKTTAFETKISIKANDKFA